MINALIFFTTCKKVSGSKLADANSSTKELSIFVPGRVPEELKLFFEVLAGTKPKMHDQYWSQILARFLPSTAKITGDVQIKWKKTVNAPGDGSVDFDETDTFRGIEMGSRVFVFKKQREQGLGAAEHNDFWVPVKSYPLSILGDVSTEEKIKYCLNTEFYEKQVIGETIAAIDGLDFALNFLPAYGGASKFFYEHDQMGLVWMAGDIASLGMAAKMKVIANSARGVVIAAGGARVINSAVKLGQGKAKAGDGVDAALAALEVGFAVVGIFNVKIDVPNSKELQSVDDLLKTMTESQRLVIPDAASAKYIAQATGRTSDDILAKGISREELSSLTHRTVASVETNGVIKALDSVSVTRAGKTYVDLKKLIPTFGDDVLFGVQGGHAFLYVKGQRLDMGVGMIMKAKVRVKSIIEDLPTALVRLNGLDEETVKKLSDGLIASVGKRSINCSQGACKVLSDHGGIITGGLVEDLVPTQVLQNMMDGKFLHGSGPLAGKPIDCDVFVTQAASVSEFIKFTDSIQDPVFGLLMASPVIVLYGIADSTGAIKSFGLLLTGSEIKNN